MDPAVDEDEVAWRFLVLYRVSAHPAEGLISSAMRCVRRVLQSVCALKFMSFGILHLQMTASAANNRLSATRHRDRAKCFVSPMRFGSGSR
jgi:hypothetical protein